MNLLNKESHIINMIKYGLILFVIIISFLITKIFINQQEDILSEEINTIKTTYYINNTKRVKEEVDRVINSLIDEKRNFEIELKKELKNRVYEAHKIATNIYNDEYSLSDNHLHSKEHIYSTIKNALGSIIFNSGRGYYFLIDGEGYNLLQPLNRDLEGENITNHIDPNGYSFAKKIIQTVHNKTESYDSYYWYKSHNKKDIYKKISFYKYFEPFNVVIGTGEYIVDFENELKDKILNKIKKIEYGDGGYVFVINLNGELLTYNKENITYPYTEKDTENGLIKLAKTSKEGFLSYSNKDEREKISYIKLFEDWNWVIGSGFYLDKLDKEIKEKEELLIQSNIKIVKNITNISIIVTLICIVISFYISKLISSRFHEYQLNIEKEIKNTIEKEKLLVQQSKMATMGEMIGNIAHQWKQPLSVISAASGLVKVNKEYKILTDNDIDHAVENIENSVNHLSTTIDDFRNFFNPHKQKETFKIESVFMKTFKLIESEFKSSNIKVILNIEDIEICTYENELLQTLINLLKNAKDELMKKEDEDLRLLLIDIFKDNESLIIKIKDNGDGIPENIKEKIFESYFTTKGNKDGTGIGLYISKQIIEEHMDGELTAKNKIFIYDEVEYSGAEFSISLPLDKK